MDDLDFGIKARGKLQAFLLVLLAIFMTALGCGILGAPMDMHPVLGYLLKAFIGLVFGGIAALCILWAMGTLRGKRGVPSELLARCLTCGEMTPHDLVCPVCKEPPQNRGTHFNIPSDSFIGELFGALILTGVGCLGLFIMIGPFIDGERRWWALIAFFALGLLMFTIGVAGFVGFILTLWNRFKGDKNISFVCHGPDRHTQGNGQIAWGKLVFLKGLGQINSPVLARGHSEGGYRVSPGDMAFAEAMATFDAAGFLELTDLTLYDWCVGGPSGKTNFASPEFKRTVDRRIIVKLSGAAFPRYDEDDEDDDIEARPPAPREYKETADDAILRFLARYFALSTSLRDFKEKIDADPAHRTQLENHARSIRDRGVIVSNPLVEAVVEALLRPNPPST